MGKRRARRNRQRRGPPSRGSRETGWAQVENDEESRIEYSTKNLRSMSREGIVQWE